MEQTAILNEINELKDELTEQNTKMEQLLSSTKNVLNTKIEQCDSTINDPNHLCSFCANVISELQSKCCGKCAKRLEQEEREIVAGWKSELDFCPQRLRDDASFCFFQRGDGKFQTSETLSEEVWSDEKLKKELQILEDLMNSESEEEEEICVLCRKLIEGHGNNAQPLHEGRCCDECNVTKVIPERFNKTRQKN